MMNAIICHYGSLYFTRACAALRIIGEGKAALALVKALKNIKQLKQHILTTFDEAAALH